MVPVMLASRYITSASLYNPRYQSRSSMYIRGLIPLNFTELAEAVPISVNNIYSNIKYIEIQQIHYIYNTIHIYNTD